ncbi:3-hydroxybutyryl-CoA dehydrogenase [Streptomyces humidus]|uniref:3-hydroxybutyryl-CoA dehydrogenase n=1 Tax=Streptomyces humidus TaxID=52259 RepID=A0A918LBT8_9ACTN|nr:3-hydroxybutyryl-CoA dehydrogenase [Streptomyces humidus]GGS27341.1 3-hydroxybutyryl-CoA dehydrogenase [Streptomyces humidus]
MPVYDKVGIIGCGTMGAGIAEVCARKGVLVRAAVASADSARRGRGRLLKSLDSAVRKGRTTEVEREEILGRISFTTDLGAFEDYGFVIESVTEDITAKLTVFSLLDKTMNRPDAVLATNTSSLPVARIAAATASPERVVGVHFFNPAPALPLVEIVSSLLTGDDTRRAAERFVRETLGKTPVHAPDRAGFIVNSLLIPYLLAAIRMLETGVAAGAVDDAMVLGCSHPMGPLRLADLIGLDTVVAIAEALHGEFREPQYAPPPLLRRMVDVGILGRKTKKGFYAYD